jgi:hypothetical protein
MEPDRSFVELNRVSTDHIRTLVNGLSDEELQQRVGQHWTIAVALAHLAFWDLRVLNVLEVSERDGSLFAPEIDVSVNDLFLPFWAAMPPRQAAKLCLETAETLDTRLEKLPQELLDEVYTYNQRWVMRSLHRNEHLNEIDAALK